MFKKIDVGKVKFHAMGLGRLQNNNLVDNLKEFN